MPYAAPRVCARCHQLAPAGKPCPCRPAYEGSRHPNSTRRQVQMRRAKLRMTPICEWPGCRMLATEVDHITPLAEDPSQRYDWANLQSLCHQHHAAKTAVDSQRGRTRRR